MKRIFTCFFAGIILIAGLVPVHGYAKEEGPHLAKEAASAILMEADTGKVLYQKNADKELPPASMTKIMTMLLIMEALKSGKISLQQKVRTSEYAASMGGSQIFLEAGEMMSVHDMLEGIAIGSANDASMAMAELIGGSEEGFVRQMNQKAKALGLKHTHFGNPTGLPAEGHYSSAKDMAVMARALLKFKKITNYTGKYEDYLRENSKEKFWLVNTNRLVKFYPGVDGLKTGFTNEAKFCLTATAKKDGMRVIAVVMGAPQAKSRNSQVTKMLDYAFGQYQVHSFYEDHALVKKVPVKKGAEEELPVVTSRKVAIITKKGDPINNIEKLIDIHSDIRAPIHKGDRVGELILKKHGKLLDRIPLIAGKNVPRASWWQLFKRMVGSFTIGSNEH